MDTIIHAIAIISIIYAYFIIKNYKKKLDDKIYDFDRLKVKSNSLEIQAARQRTLNRDLEKQIQQYKSTQILYKQRLKDMRGYRYAYNLVMNKEILPEDIWSEEKRKKAKEFIDNHIKENKE